MCHRSTLLLLLGSLVALNLGAKDAGPDFIAPTSINVTQLLPDPPTLGSEENQAEVDLLLQLQTGRTDAQNARITNEVSLTVFNFSDVLGPWFTEQDCPQTAHLFTEVSNTVEFFETVGKAHWARPRPSVSYSQIHPYSKIPVSPTYPSGHATEAMAYAEILAAVLPEKQAALLERARQIGFDRVIDGVHYPSDIAAGRVLGHVVARALLESKDFQAELDRVRAELQQASQPALAH